MRHRVNRFQLNRFTSWRRATVLSLVRNLIIQQSIKTTKARASLAQPVADKLISLAKENTLTAKRQAFKLLGDHSLVSKLFRDASRFNNRAGGYTRILNLGSRRGDNASMVLFELTEIKKKAPVVRKKKKDKEVETTSEPILTTSETQKETPAEVKEKPLQIDIRLADRLKKIKPSSTLAITSKAKKLKSEGRDVISFAAGEPDFDTPDFIKDSAIEAIRAGFTKYTPTTGTPELKQSIIEKFKKDNGLEYAANQVIVSCGAKHSIFNTILALVGERDEVLIPLPFWVSYPEMVHLAQGVPCFINAEAKNNFKITPEQLAKHLTPRTKLLILNSPSNPSGCVYTRQELEKIADICVK
ncbi:MAG: 50S ribosomal protein L17, partial [Candidatus Omnitrophica bacterium]|nr:50S ribosomal protein L17 [Candidatus Omnitrophota bacterium]